MRSIVALGTGRIESHGGADDDVDVEFGELFPGCEMLSRRRWLISVESSARKRTVRQGRAANATETSLPRAGKVLEHLGLPPRMPTACLARRSSGCSV